MCEFRFRLVVTSDFSIPLIRDSSADLLKRVSTLNLALIASYKRRFKVGTFVKQIIGTIGLATAAMRVVEGKIQAAMNLTEAFGSAVTGFADQASALLRKPGDMVTSMTGTATRSESSRKTKPRPLRPAAVRPSPTNSKLAVPFPLSMCLSPARAAVSSGMSMSEAEIIPT